MSVKEPTPDERLLLAWKYAKDMKLPCELNFIGLGVPSNSITITSPKEDWRWTWGVDWPKPRTNVYDHMANLTKLVMPEDKAE